jgi:ubiquitin carboxyl-terminal hydrolase 5/13
MGKVADGLLSGRYAIPRPLQPEEAPTTPAFQEGVKPSGFKTLIGKGHPEFATMRQQDAAEFLGHLVKTLQASSKRHSLEDVTRTFRFLVEQKLKCDTCGGVRLRVDEEDKLTLIVPAIEKVAATNADEPGMDVDASEAKGKGAAEGENKTAPPTAAKVEFETVELASLLESFVAPRTLDEYRCPKCDKKVSATQCATLRLVNRAAW